jgi:hypothetical protein
MESPLVALFQLIDAFKILGIDYVVVGSLASSVHGEYRASADLDVLTKISLGHVSSLVNSLAGFYIDDLAASRAIAQGRSFNVIHLESIFKIDVFTAITDFDKQQLARRQSYVIETDVPRDIWIATAEDTIVAKLRWFRLGGEVSELQWRDIKGVLGTQGTKLDAGYMRLWADRIGVADLLERAIREIG